APDQWRARGHEERHRGFRRDDGLCGSCPRRTSASSVPRHPPALMELLFRPLEKIGRRTVAAVSEVGYAAMLLVDSLRFALWGWRIGQPVRLRMIFEQMRQVGVDAIPIVALLS